MQTPRGQASGGPDRTGPVRGAGGLYLTQIKGGKASADDTKLRKMEFWPITTAKAHLHPGAEEWRSDE